MTNKEKAREISDSRHCIGLTCEQCRYMVAIEMAKWKDKQFKDYFYSVLSIKMLYFLNEKEKRENTTIDKMDWHKTMDEFAHYLKQQENNSETTS